MSKKRKNKNVEVKKTGFNDQSTRWANKFNLNEMQDVNPDDIKQQNKENVVQANSQKPKKENATQANQQPKTDFCDRELLETIEKCKSPKQIGLKIAEGAIAGSSFVLPVFGYGSALATFKDNSKTIQNIKKTFFSKPFKTWGWNLLLMLPMFLMWLITFIIAYVIFASISNADFGPIIYFLGIGVSLSCIPLILLLKENSVPYSSKSVNEMKDNDSKWKLGIGIGVGCFVLIIAFSLIIRFAWSQDNNLLQISGFSTLSNKALIELGIDANISEEIVKSFANTQQIIILLFGSIFSGFFSLLPGLSSGVGFALMGNYRLVNEAMYVGFTDNSVGSFTNNEAWPIIIVSAIGYLVGFIGSLYLVSFLLTKNERFFNTISIWMLLGITIGSFVALSDYDYRFLGNHGVVLGISLLFLLLGMCSSIPKLTIHFVKQKQQQYA